MFVIGMHTLEPVVYPQSVTLQTVLLRYYDARGSLEEEKPEKKRDNDALFSIAVDPNTGLVMFCANGWGMTIGWLSSG